MIRITDTHSGMVRGRMVKCSWTLERLLDEDEVMLFKGWLGYEYEQVRIAVLEE